MNEQAETKRKKNETDNEATDPIVVIRKGAIAASVWRGKARAAMPITTTH